VDEVNQRCKVICDGWDMLGDLTHERSNKLAVEIEKAERLDNLWLNYAKKASPFNNWMDGAKEDLMDLFSVHSIEEVEDLKDAQEKFKANMPAAQEEFESILALQQAIDEMSTLENPYTNTKAADLQAKWEEILVLIPKRDQSLTEETSLQQTNERLRVQFAQMANDIGAWIQQRTQKMAEIGMSARGTLENQLAELKSLNDEINEFKNQILELNNTNNVVQEAMIFENPHTAYTMEIIRIRFEQLLTGSTRNINEVENQIMMRDSFGISEDQMKELRASFNHFDKSKNGQLEYREFKQCLVSLGHTIDVDSSEQDFKNICALVDPNGVGFISFQAFLDYMTREMADNDTADQVIESFRILAGDKPYITPDELRRELAPEQAEYCIARMGAYTGADAVPGALDYRSFSTALYGESDL
jgi:actinin alpha